MILDAQTFTTVLTPEAAIGVVHKALAQKGWHKSDVNDIKLVYTPFWFFSFDVLAPEGPSPSGKTALNAFTGEMNDFVPMLLDRPLKKGRATLEGAEAEVEPTAIGPAEAKEVAATKLAAHVGIKKEMVHTAAFTKMYVPFYRAWVDVAGDTFKFDVDAMLGVPLGLEAVPAKPKGWSEEASETISKMKSPSGLIALVTGLFKGGPDAIKGGPGKYAIFIALVAILLFFILSRQGLPGGGAVEAYCSLDSKHLGAAPFLGIGSRPIVPNMLGNNTFELAGNCYFKAKQKQTSPLVLRAFAKDGELPLASNVTIVRELPVSDIATEKPFTLTWQGEAKTLIFGYEKS